MKKKDVHLCYFVTDQGTGGMSDANSGLESVPLWSAAQALVRNAPQKPGCALHCHFKSRKPRLRRRRRRWWWWWGEP